MWETLGLYALINKWRFIQPTNSEIFRISHFLDGGIISKPRATIATGFIDENSKVNTFEPSYFSPREDFQIFELAFPAGLPSHSLGFIRIDDGPGNWIVKVEAFRSNSVEDNFANYLLARFGVTGSLFTGMVKQDLIPVSSSIELQPGFIPQVLVPANPNRAYLRIRAQGSPVYIWADKFHENGQPLVLLEEIDKGKTISLPTINDGIYKGAIYAHTTKEQFSKPISGSIPTVIRSFKSAVSKRINLMCRTTEFPIWQRNYYESITRIQTDLNGVRQYIINNPRQWAEDEENIQHYPDYQAGNVIDLDLYF